MPYAQRWNTECQHWMASVFRELRKSLKPRTLPPPVPAWSVVLLKRQESGIAYTSSGQATAERDDYGSVLRARRRQFLITSLVGNIVSGSKQNSKACNVVASSVLDGADAITKIAESAWGFYASRKMSFAYCKQQLCILSCSLLHRLTSSTADCLAFAKHVSNACTYKQLIIAAYCCNGNLLLALCLAWAECWTYPFEPSVHSA